MMLTTLIAQQSIASSLDAILKHTDLNGSLTGVYVTDINGNKLFGQNQSTRFMPASNEKILTCVFALDVLGPQYRPATKFWKVGNDIYVEPSGDPLITSSQLQQIRQELNPSPNSKFYIKTPFSTVIPVGWELDDLAFRYAAPISWLTVDKGTFLVTKRGLDVAPPTYSQVKVKYTHSSKFNLVYDRDAQLLHVYGSARGQEEPYGQFALPNPFESAGLILGGRFKQTDSVPNKEPDYVHYGSPVSEMVKLCLEPSDNIIAEHLLLMATNKLNPLSDNPYAQAQKAMSDHYEKVVKVPSRSLRPQDGSGMSRHNLVTPEALAHILRHAYSSEYRDIFLNGLPESGEGTLSNRLKGVQVYAKTGTLDSASALSGYVNRKDGSTLIFSIIMNHYDQPSSRMRALQDEIVRILAQ